MSKQNLSTVTYAAGAGLAAIALVYVFAPTYIIDEASSPRKPHAVGLRNIGNDCFINSVLQALAGCGELRLYLIRETHRRAIDADVYTRHLVQPTADGRAALRDWQLRSLQSGAVSAGLKEILDKLNERPISKKAISPREFVGVLERAFGQMINRQQQDAQEFLQLLVERLQDEYHAGKRARAYTKRLQRQQQQQQQSAQSAPDPTEEGQTAAAREDMGENASSEDKKSADEGKEDEDEDEHDFPLEGEREAQSCCQTCGFKTTPRKEVFCMLTLSVPQASATTLDRCFDGLFKTEHIPDYRCDRCRLIHARDTLAASHAQNPTPTSAADLERLQHSIDHDPENPPRDIALPDAKLAPTSTISRSHRMTRFPRVLVIHLSRSIYERTASTKNMAKVAFPENLRLGGLRQRKRYRLLATVTHKGGHQSGHYQSFRRQAATPPPFSNPHVSSGVYAARDGKNGKTASSTPGDETEGSEESNTSSRNGKDRDRSDAGSIRSAAASALSKLSPSKSADKEQRETPPSKVTLGGKAPGPAARRRRQMWWRINDEKCKAARTGEVLDMEREVYLLFYELLPDEGEGENVA